MSDKSNIPEGYVWNEQYQCYRNEEDKAVDENGRFLVGFADPKFREQHQNKTGRPKGGRNRSALERAQMSIDNLADLAVENLRMIACNEWKKLGLTGPISPTTMANANKTLLDKAISQEKEKLQEEKETEESMEEVYTPAAVVDFNSKRK